jgi:hypothetical protein
MAGNNETNGEILLLVMKMAVMANINEMYQWRSNGENNGPNGVTGVAAIGMSWRQWRN